MTEISDITFSLDRILENVANGSDVERVQAAIDELAELRWSSAILLAELKNLVGAIAEAKLEMGGHVGLDDARHVLDVFATINAARAALAAAEGKT